MVDKIETMLLLLGVVSLLAVLATKLRFPFPILLVIAGLFIGLAPGLPVVRLDPDIVFMVFLPPLLFSAAWNFPWDHFRSNLVPIFGMAVGLVFLTIATVGYTLHWLVPGMTLATGFVLGAIISPPDAVAANAVLKNLRVPKRLMTILEGESLVNDASGLVAYHFAVLAVVTGTFSWGQAGLDFAWMSVGGVGLGLGIGWVVVHAHRLLKDPAVENALTIITPYVVYLLAEKIGASGVLAVVAAGLFIGNRSWAVMETESRMQRDIIWNFIDYILNGMVFILIGLQFKEISNLTLAIDLKQILVLGLLLAGIIVAVRFIWMVPMVWLEKRIRRRSAEPQDTLSKRELVVASWAGMRGVVSLATAMALPFTTETGAEFPFRDSIQILTFIVIFFTLVIQGLTLPTVVRRLKVEENSEDDDSLIKARYALWELAIRRVDEEIARTTDEAELSALEIWQEELVERLQHIREIDAPTEKVQPDWRKQLQLLPVVAHEIRHKLAVMHHEGVISEEVRRLLLYDMDIEEQRLRNLIRARLKRRR